MVEGGAVCDQVFCAYRRERVVAITLEYSIRSHTVDS